MRKITTIIGIIVICGLFSGLANGSSNSLSRVVSVLKILAKMEGNAIDADIYTDGKVTIADAIYGLQLAAELRIAPSRLFAGGASNARIDGSTGAVKSWGGNDVGQLGTGNTTDFTATPTSVDLGAGKNARQVAVGIEHACAILNDDSVSCWGSNSSGQLGQPLTTTSSSSPLPVPAVTAKAVAVGLEHTCIITLTGSVQCWGSNVRGQLGQPADGLKRYQPQAAITGLSAKTIKSVYNFTCAIASDDTVKCWGDNLHGQLGNNSKVDSSVIVSAGSLAGVTQLTVGAYHSCASTSSSISCWGRNDSGELGSNGTTSLSVPTRTTAVRANVGQLVAGASHTCALSGTTVECWGSNASKQLSGSTAGGTSFVKAPLTNSPLSLSAGLNHTCVQDSKNETYCWGAGTQGRLGPNATADSATPVLVDK